MKPVIKNVGRIGLSDAVKYFYNNGKNVQKTINWLLVVGASSVVLKQFIDSYYL